MTDSKAFQDTINRFIELYGDRTEAIGDEIHAGLAWIEDTKFVLIAGESVVLQPPSWRRISRLINLAEQLRRPVLLWDLPLQADMAEPTTTLLHKRSAQNSRLQLMKLSVPIISVFEKLPFQSDSAPVDAVLLLQMEAGDAPPQLSKTEPPSTLVKGIDNPAQLKSEALKLFNHLSTVPVETLIHQRFATIRQTVSIPDSTAENPPQFLQKC